MKNLGAVNSAWHLSKISILTAILVAGHLSVPSATAQADPYSGYTGYSSSYFLEYANGTSFSPSNTSDVQVHVGIGGSSHLFNVDTGSRGLYASITELGSDVIGPGAYQGQIELDSSGRLSTGMWTPTSLSFDVTDRSGQRTTVTSSANILVVTTLSAQMGRTATFGINTSVAGYTGTVNLDGGGTVPVQYNSSTGEYYVELTQNATINQQISYANNIAGLIKNVSNFGIGFDLNGAPGGTGPVGNNQNQIYNALINLDEMKTGSLVAGYIVKSTGIQLGLTSEDRGYAYTSLNPTGFTSTNSVPDWQTPMGETTVHGVTHEPGSIVMDSGIDDAFISDPHLTIGDQVTDPIIVSLMNSEGLVGYHIDLSDTNNVLNPTSVLVVRPGTDGIYSQNQPPYQGQFFNTGRNVFKAFDMLYDAENGYMGVITNSYGATDPNVFFAAQAGGFTNPIPEAKTAFMLLLGLLAFLPFAISRSRKIRRQRS